MTYRKTLTFTLLLGAGLLSACSKSDPAAPSAAGTGPAAAASDASHNMPVRPVRYTTVGVQTIGDDTQLPGEIRPRHEQRYGFRVGGKIAQRLVDVGQEVKAGQALAVLDAQDIQPAIDSQSAQLEVARADLALQESELKRQQALRDQGFVSTAALERQQASTEAARARLNAAKAQLANAQNGRDFQTLRADRNGVVMAIDADAGSVVAAGQSVARVAQLGEKELVINVPERAVGTIRKATGFVVTLDAVADKTYQATLRELAPVADPASRTYAARLAVTGADAAMQLGMSASVQINLANNSALVVPNSALYTRDDHTQVWLIHSTGEGKDTRYSVKPITVELGASTANGVVIRTGLKAGDRVVTAGANLLLTGQPVKLLDAAQP